MLSPKNKMNNRKDYNCYALVYYNNYMKKKKSQKY